jgi:hypothetical protein
MVSTKTVGEGGSESKTGERGKIFFPRTRSPRLFGHVHLLVITQVPEKRNNYISIRSQRIVPDADSET